MPDENITPRGFSIGDLASPEVVSERVRAWTEPVSAEDAGANFREAVRKLHRHEGHTTEEMRQIADGVRAMADSVAVLGIGSVVKAAADAEAERVLRAREEPGRG
jgi:hypothetical protein